MGSPKGLVPWAPYSIFFANFARNSQNQKGAICHDFDNKDEPVGPINYCVKEEVDENYYTKRSRIERQHEHDHGALNGLHEEVDDHEDATSDGKHKIFIILIYVHKYPH